MKIGIDVFGLLTPGSGIERYIYNLLTGLLGIAPENEYYLVEMRSRRSLFRFSSQEELDSCLDSLEGVRKMLYPLKPFALYGRALMGRIRGQDALSVDDMDIFFGPNYRGVFGERVKTVITIHDMSHIYYPKQYPGFVLRYHRKVLPRAARMASAVITDSENTKRDVMKYLKVSEDRLRVTYLAAERRFRRVSGGAALARVKATYGLAEKFVLYVGALQERKNVPGLIRAFHKTLGMTCVPLQLVMAGGVEWGRQGINKLVSELGIEERVRFAGHVSDADLPALYSLADFLVFPSFYEGFGLPVLEAMACGTPVVASGTSSIPEVTGDAALLVDPHSPDDIAAGMVKMLSDEGLRQKCRERGLERAKLFTWDRCARETMEVFQDCLARREAK